MAKLYSLARMTTTTVGTGTITLGSAVSPFLTFANAGVVDQDIVDYAILDGANSEIGFGLYTASGTTLTRNVRKSTNSNAAISLSGTAQVFITPAAESLVNQPFTPGGRLTLQTLVPVMTSSQTAKTTIFYTPYKGNYVPIYNGSSFEPFRFTELSQTTTDTTKSPAAVAANSAYDMFVWNDAGTLRCTRGPLWTNLTTRSSGTALVMKEGILVNNLAITNGPGVNKGTYVGTVRSNGSSQIDWQLGGAASGGTAANLMVWNYYNRIMAVTQVTDNGTTYSYNGSASRQARGSAAMQVGFMSGMAEDAPFASYGGSFQSAGVANSFAIIGVSQPDVTSSYQGPPALTQTVSTSNSTEGAVSTAWYAPLLGWHVIAALEQADGTNFSNFNLGAYDVLNFAFLM